MKSYVIQTTDSTPATEKIANAKMIAAGFKTTWLATVKQRTVRRCTRSIVDSLFPGYLFVDFDASTDAWKVIPLLRDPNGRGVHSILGAGPMAPTPLPSGALERLQRDFEAGEFRPRVEPDFVAGDRLSVIVGPWAGQIGVCDLSDEERVNVLMQAFGHLRPIQFRRDMLRRAAS